MLRTLFQWPLRLFQPKDASRDKDLDNPSTLPASIESEEANRTQVAAPSRGFLDALKRLVHIPTANAQLADQDISLPRTGDPQFFDRMADWLPWVVYDEKTGLFWIEGKKPGTYEGIGFCMELTPQTGASETMANVLAGLTRLAAPAGTGVQVTLMGSPCIEPIVNCALDSTITREEAQELEKSGRKGAATVQQAEAMHSMAQRMASHLYKGSTDELFRNFNYRFKDYRVVLSVIWPTSNPQAPKVQQEVLAMRDQVASATGQFYLFDRHWGPDDLLSFAALLLNPHRMYQRDWPQRHYDDSKELRHQVLDNDNAIDIEESRVLFSSRADQKDAIAMRALSVKNYPQQMSLNEMVKLLGSPYNDRAQYTGPFVITAGFSYLDYDREKNRVQLRSARAQQNAEGPMARYMPQLVDIASDWKMLQEAYDVGLGSVKMYHQVLVYSRPEAIDEAEGAAKAIWREAGFELQRDRFVQIQGLLGALPMTFGPLLQRDMAMSQRLSTKTSYNAANLLPLLAEWKGTGPRQGKARPTPQLLLGGRRGQVMMIDIFANPSGNNNACVVGKSRSGKSFTLNMMINRTLASGGRAWVFDIGGSYTKMCKRLGGQILTFSSDSKISLNPFSIVTDLEEDIDMIKGVVARMIKPTEAMSDFEMSQLDLHIRSVILDAQLDHSSPDSRRPFPWPTIEDLAMSLINNCERGGPNPLSQDPEWKAKVRTMSAEERRAICDPRIADLGRSLMPYTAEGSYGRWFTGPANVNFDSNFILLEMDHLSSKPELRAVVLMLLMYLIAQNIYMGRKEFPKLCLLDEAWDLMRTGATSKFIEGLYRKVAKHGGAVVTATQGVDDYYGSETAEAALKNADWMFLLQQKEESIEQISRSGKLILDDSMKRELRSVRRVGNQYSEIFIKATDYPPTVGRLFADPYSLLLSSTSPSEVQALEDLQSRGMTVDEAIQHMLKQGAHA
jgi:conjugal transfer ATP-binding protein TraC